MTGPPQSVRDRLAAQQQLASSHPDADMLNAFVEDALSAGERSSVLDHLARCPTCREVVAISGSLTQESAEAPVAVVPARSLRWNWAVLRWAAPLAAVVVVGAAVLLRERTRPADTYAPTTHQAEVRPETGILKEQESGNETPRAIAPTENAATKDASPSAPPSAPSKKEIDEYGWVAKQKADRSPVQERKAENIATTSPEGGALASQSAPGYDKIAPLPAPSVDAAREQSLPAPRTRQDQDFRARQTVEIQSAAAPPAQKEVAKAQAVGQTTGPSVAAAPSPRRNGTFPAGNASNNYVLSDTIELHKFPVDWRMSSGRLTKTYDGVAWQEQELPGNPTVTVFAVVGPHVWAGGKKGVLFHSLNSGDSWTQVHLGTPATQEDIREIHFTNITFGTVTTSNGAKWTTNDAGQTWSRD